MKPLFRTARNVLRTLGRNMLLSAVTILFLACGTAAVVAMSELGQGSASAVEKTIAKMGPNNLLVLPGAVPDRVDFGKANALTLTPQDAEAISRECPAVHSVAPVVRARTQANFGDRGWVPTYVYGTTPSFLDVRDWTDLEEGVPFNDLDVRNQACVCLIGQTIKHELFGGESPIGRDIRMQNVSYKVIGVLSSRGVNMMGMDQDDIILAPWTSIRSRVAGAPVVAPVDLNATIAATTTINTLNQAYPGDKEDPLRAADIPQRTRFANVDQILVRAASTEEIPVANREITDLLRERHRIKPGQPDDFGVRDMTEMTKALGSATQKINRSLMFVGFGGLASVILGGIGILAMTQLSARARTREIELSIADGARPAGILRQFLVEAAIVCLLGSMLGIALGHLVAIAFNVYLRWPIESSTAVLLGSLAASIGVGIAFGFYPAWKASKILPRSRSYLQEGTAIKAAPGAFS